MRPTSGKVAPGEKCQIHVLLQIQSDNVDYNQKDKFQIASIKIPQNIIALDPDEMDLKILELWKHNEHITRSADGGADIIAQRKIRCLLLPPITSSLIAESQSSADDPRVGSALGEIEIHIPSACRSDLISANNLKDTEATTLLSESHVGLSEMGSVTAGDVVDSKIKVDSGTFPPRPAIDSPRNLDTLKASGLQKRPLSMNEPKTISFAPTVDKQNTQNLTVPGTKREALSRPQSTTPSRASSMVPDVDRIATLQAACDGYKAELERINHLRQRRVESMVPIMEKAGASGMVSLQVCAFIALLSFLIGARYF